MSAIRNRATIEFKLKMALRLMPLCTQHVLTDTEQSKAFKTRHGISATLVPFPDPSRRIERFASLPPRESESRHQNGRSRLLQSIIVIDARERAENGANIARAHRGPVSLASTWIYESGYILG